jgi:hypothetical protein
MRILKGELSSSRLIGNRSEMPDPGRSRSAHPEKQE